MKEPKCTTCGKSGHYTAFCFRTLKKKIATKPIVRKPQKPIKRTAIKKTPQSNRAKLVREADRAFSVYIRKKDAVNGIARCVTCGDKDKWKNMQNGHYLSRKYIQIRWDEQNVGVQCSHCNMDLGGNLVKYRQHLLNKYGFDPTEMLKKRVQTRGKVTLPDIQSIIDKYS